MAPGSSDNPREPSGGSSPELDPGEGEATPAPRVWRRRVALAAKLLVAFGLVGYLAATGGIRWSQLADGFRSPWTLLYALAAVGATVLLATTRWQLLLRAVDVELTWRKTLQLTMIGNFFNTFMPGSVGGDPLRAYYATRHAPPGRRVEAATTVLVDRALGLGTLLLICVVGLALQPFLREGSEGLGGSMAAVRARLAPALIVVGVLVLVGVAAMALLLHPRFRSNGRVQAILGRVPGVDVMTRVARTLVVALTHKVALFTAVACSAASHLLTITVFYAFGDTLGLIPTPLEHVILVPLGLTLNAIPGPPQGFGVGELAFESLYRAALGTKASVGAETCLLWRVIILFWNIVGGAVYIAYRRPALDGSVARGGSGGSVGASPEDRYNAELPSS